MGKVLDGRNWKYRIAFDIDMYKDVIHHSLYYSAKERSLYNKQIEFYRNHFTFQEMLKFFSYLKTEDDIKFFKQDMIIRKNQILYCPKELKQYYTKEINAKYPDHKEFLMEMLNFATNGDSVHNPMLTQYKNVFGGYYGAVKSKLKKYSRRVLPILKQTPIKNETEIMSLVRNVLKKLTNDQLYTSVWGHYDVNRMRLEFNNDFGLGKAVSKQFYDKINDAFIIQTNEKTITKEQLEYSVYRNVFPGRLHLFNSVIPNTKYCFDSGADFIVNGWSTFSAWHMYPSVYTKYTKILNSKIAYKLLSRNWQKSLSDIYLLLLSVTTKQNADKYLIEITQYPGRFESYVMGAIGVEQLINKKFATNPMGLLDEFKKCDIADFFGMYKKNKNKC